MHEAMLLQSFNQLIFCSNEKYKYQVLMIFFQSGSLFVNKRMFLSYCLVSILKLGEIIKCEFSRFLKKN